MSAPLPKITFDEHAKLVFHASPDTHRDGVQTLTPEDILEWARFPENPLSIALACVIAEATKSRAPSLLRGLTESSFQVLIQNFFPGISLRNHWVNAVPPNNADEYEDLVALLMAHRKHPTTALEWLCHAISSASLHDNHLWQDMGLPNRKVLSQLMQDNFPTLAEKNNQDMKWKKFFYRQLCEQAEILVCKSPNCGDCCDYALCFASEEA
jgi:nitrogen fixation protein NifQ